MTREAEEILDRCIDWKRAGKDPEDILREHPEVSDEVRSLLAIASDLEDLPDVPPSIEGMMKVVAQLSVKQEEERESPRRAVGLFSRPVLVRVAAIFLCVSLLGWGSVTASSNTVPGDLLYPVKLLTERVKFLVTINREDRVELRLVFSEERLKEVVKKYQKGAGIDRELLKAMLAEAKVAVDQVAGLSGISRDFLISRTAHLSEFQRRTLEELKEGASPGERRELSRFAELCSKQCMVACGMMNGGAGKSGSDVLPSEKAPGTAMKCPMCRRPHGHHMDGNH